MNKTENNANDEKLGSVLLISIFFSAMLIFVSIIFLMEAYRTSNEGVFGLFTSLIIVGIILLSILSRAYWLGYKERKQKRGEDGKNKT